MLNRNLRLIPIHELLVRTSPWGAVFVLFTRSGFGVDGAMRIAALYYLAVVVFEVPSGWMSDRFGRVLTLRIVAAAWVGAYVCWLVGDGQFVVVAAGQVLMALGYASLSGTDVTFHYDTLEALGRAGEYPDRQARVASIGLAVGAVGMLVGGALGLIDLRWAFAASLVLGVAQLGVAMALREPPRTSPDEAIVPQLGATLGYLRDVPLRWIFGYGIALVVLEHVAFSLMAPWLTETLGEAADDLESTPILVGATMAAVALVGAFSARLSVPMARRFGLRNTLVSLGALSAVIVTAMAAAQHVAVLPLVALRSVQGAAAAVLISAAVAPLVAQHHRATMLSLNSLGGRLLWGSLLLVLSSDVGDDVSRPLWRYSAVSWALVIVTLATAIAVTRRHGPAHLTNR